MNYPKVVGIYSLANKPFVPSNGSEGMIFTGAWCDNCLHQHPDPDNERQCEIILRSWLGERTPEWRHDSEGWATCSEWRKWDWGRDDDRDGWNEPPKPTPISPDQLWLPFEVMDLLGIGPGEVLVTQKAIVEI